MPLYEYRCHTCGKTIEVIQKFSDEPLKVHADCGGDLEKLISRSALQFKGTGWYVTDYAKSGSSPSAATGSSESKSGESKSSEAKSAESKGASDSSSSSAPAAAPAPSSSSSDSK